MKCDKCGVVCKGEVKIECRLLRKICDYYHSMKHGPQSYLHLCSFEAMRSNLSFIHGTSLSQNGSRGR